MNSNDTSLVEVNVKLGESLPRGDTNWDYLDALTDEAAYEAALGDPDAQPVDPERLARMHRVSRVKLLRRRLGMTQIEFARSFQIPVSTLRDWEQRRTTPDAPARALLRAIEREPETMRRLLERAA